ncbi:regulator of sigma subunit [Chlamydia gallinacea]|uniref:regulator of sigma subunit n=1 Tax=Chlamydia gallinacea TaxID=1457153 RepID=UPI00044E2510|nr:regulator of sigma subunit [Chlamydia gallinacea]EYE60660.1 stage II sporulation E family protein [Bacteroides fragilis str. S6L5]
MKQNFTKRILFFLFLVIPIPLILNLIVLSVFSFSAAKNTIISNLHTHATHFNLEFEKKLSIHKMFLKRLANTLALKSNTAEDFAQAYYEALSIADSDFSLCLIPLANENIQAKNPLDPFIRYLKHHPESKKKLSKNAGKACILAVPSETQQKQDYYLVITENIETWNSSIHTGLLVSFYPMHFLQKDLFRSLHLQNEDICLLNKYGEVLFSSNPELFSSVFSLDVPSFPKITPRLPAIPIKKAPKFFQENNLIRVQINNTSYLGIFLNHIPIQGIYSLSLVPESLLITKSIKLPLNVIFFYSLAFLCMGWILTKMNKRLNHPIQELATCMESAWRGNHNIRYESCPYAYEINELGNIFNCTLLLLLNSKEKAEIEYVSGNKLQKELTILGSLQQTLLSQKFPDFPQISFESHHLGTQVSGQFCGWKATQDNLLGVLGIAEDVGLPSYLYALSARSLFLTYADLFSSLEKISTETYVSFKKGTEGSCISITFLKYSSIEGTLELMSVGDTPPLVFLKKENAFFQLFPPIIQKIHPKDILLCITGNPQLADYLLHLPIEELLKDSLSPINSDNFIDTLKELLNQAPSPDGGTISFFTFNVSR